MSSPLSSLKRSRSWTDDSSLVEGHSESKVSRIFPDFILFIRWVVADFD
jgi:hypothetical protein